MDGENTPQTPMPQMKSSQNYAIPFAIVIAGLAIAGAIYFGDTNKAALPTPTTGSNTTGVIDPVLQKEHILGNPNAKVVIIEYSDPECPFCKMFHPTMERIMSEYGQSGNVAWVYRQFPIASLHPKAHHEAEAIECANKLGGNTKFWEYLNRIFEITPGNNQLDPAELPKIAKTVGLDVDEFNKCLSSGEMIKVVDEGLASGARAKVNGTPLSIILVNKKPVDSINGAQPYETVKAQIDALLK